MRTMITDNLHTPGYKKVKVRAINQTKNSIKLFSGVKDAAAFFEVSSQKICRTILEAKILEKDGNMYHLERYC